MATLQVGTTKAKDQILVIETNSSIFTYLRAPTDVN